MAEQVYLPGAGPASGRVTPASFPFFTTGEDNLRLLSYNSAPGVALRVNARTLSPGGKVVVSSWKHTPNTDRTLAQDDFTLSGTTILNLVVLVSAGTPRLGQTFVILQLIRGTGTAALVLGVLLQGEVATSQPLGFPGSPIASTSDGGGFQRAIIGTQPAPGVDWIETVPTNARWQLLSCQATIVTAAGGVDRWPGIYHVIGGSQYVASAQTKTTAASSSQSCWWEAGMPLETGFGFVGSVAGIPTPFMLLAGNQFRAITANLQPGDQWTAPNYMVREWLDP